MIIRILKRTIIPFVFIFGHCRITTMLNIFQQDILKWSLYIDFAILNIEIITFNSDPTVTTEQQTTTHETTTDETTTMKTNNGSKYSWRTIIIGAVLGTCVLSGIIIILIVLVIKQRNKRNITKTPKQDISNGTLERTYTDPPANMAMQHR